MVVSLSQPPHSSTLTLQGHRDKDRETERETDGVKERQTERETDGEKERDRRRERERQTEGERDGLRLLTFSASQSDCRPPVSPTA